MIRKVVYYGHPALRKKDERVEAITPTVQTLIQDLLETMHEAHGIGLAAQEVGEAVQVTVMDVRGVENRPLRRFAGSRHSARGGSFEGHSFY